MVCYSSTGEKTLYVQEALSDKFLVKCASPENHSASFLRRGPEVTTNTGGGFSEWGCFYKIDFFVKKKLVL